MQTNLFRTHVFLNSVLGATPNRINLKYRCSNKRSNQIRVVYVVSYQIVQETNLLLLEWTNAKLEITVWEQFHEVCSYIYLFTFFEWVPIETLFINTSIPLRPCQKNIAEGKKKRKKEKKQGNNKKHYVN